MAAHTSREGSLATISDSQNESPSKAAVAALKLRVEAAKLTAELNTIKHNEKMQALALAAAEAAGVPAASHVNNTDEPSEQFPPQVLTTVTQFPGVQARDISLILSQKFDAINLPRLRLGVGAPAEELRHTTRLDPLTSQLVVTKARGQYKDFGEDPFVWTESFLIYIRIIYVLHATEHPSIIPAMLHFLSRVLRYSQSYQWVAVRRFAIDWHNSVLAQGYLDPTIWRTIPDEWVSAYISQDVLRSAKRAKVDLPVRAGAVQPKGSNDALAICMKWNSTNGCSQSWCKRRHECEKCASSEHPAYRCRK